MPSTRGKDGSDKGDSMARRNEGILDMVVELPWWIGVILAAVTYAGFRYGLPAVWPPNGSMEGVMAQTLAMLAPLFAFALLVAAAASAIRGAVSARREGQEQSTRVAQGVGSCPKCGSQLVLRVARRGANAGGKFWGCSGFPKCRYIQDYVR